jgi:hypothetical protein
MPTPRFESNNLDVPTNRAVVDDRVYADPALVKVFGQA